MTIHQFNSLDEMLQLEAVCEYGVHISEREDQFHCFILYQIEAFYIEFRYHVEQNRMTKLRSFSSTDELQPYLDRIMLP